MALVRLFFTFFKIGLFAIGGAYSFLPLIEREAVEKYSWLSKEEFLEITGITKIFPGAISVKFATYTGYKIAGIPGAIVANLGNIIGPAVLIIILLGIYSRYKDLPRVRGALTAIQLAVFAMIIAACFQLINVNQILQLKNILIVIISFALFTYTKVHPALIILAAGCAGILLK